MSRSRRRTSSTSEGGGSADSAMSPLRPSACKRSIGEQSDAKSPSASSSAVPASAMTPESTVKVSGRERMSLRRPGTKRPRSERRSLSSAFERIPYSCSTPRTSITSASSVLRPARVTMRLLALPESVSCGWPSTRALSDTPSGSATSSSRRNSPASEREQRPRTSRSAASVW